MGTLKFNGVTILDNDSTFTEPKIEGVVIQTPPLYEFPAKRVSTIQIQGRNGDIIMDKNSYENVLRSYNIASVFRAGETFVSRARELVDWLTSTNGYARLEDSYEPLYFRLAMYRAGGRFPNYFDKATAIKIDFECKPQRFLITGETPEDLDDATWVNIVNTTNYVALPEITINGEDVKLEFSDTEDGTIISDITIQGEVVNGVIDSELQDSYDDTEYLNNRTIMTNGFPKLYPGDNWVRVTSTVFASAVIKPRTWVL